MKKVLIFLITFFVVGISSVFSIDEKIKSTDLFISDSSANCLSSPGFSSIPYASTGTGFFYNCALSRSSFNVGNASGLFRLFSVSSPFTFHNSTTYNFGRYVINIFSFAIGGDGTIRSLVYDVKEGQYYFSGVSNTSFFPLSTGFIIGNKFFDTNLESANFHTFQNVTDVFTNGVPTLFNQINKYFIYKDGYLISYNNSDKKLYFYSYSSDLNFWLSNSYDLSSSFSSLEGVKGYLLSNIGGTLVLSFYLEGGTYASYIINGDTATYYDDKFYLFFDSDYSYVPYGFSTKGLRLSTPFDYFKVNYFGFPVISVYASSDGYLNTYYANTSGQFYLSSNSSLDIGDGNFPGDIGEGGDDTGSGSIGGNDNNNNNNNNNGGNDLGGEGGWLYNLLNRLFGSDDVDFSEIENIDLDSDIGFNSAGFGDLVVDGGVGLVNISFSGSGLNDIQYISGESDSCYMFNINTLNFMYHSDASISLSSGFSFTNIGIFDNIVGSFGDKLFGAIVGPLNSFYGFIKILFPFGFDDKQYCLFGKVFTIQQHKLFIDSPEYQTFTFIDYLIIFAVFLLLISGISLVGFPSYLSESEREERFNELGKNKVLKQKRKSNTRLNKVLKKK